MAAKKKTPKKGFPPKKGDMDSKNDKSMSKKSKGKKNC
jgi:hypothetical protein